ncbi:scarecrow-like protein 28 [Rutidosis leptorrhynchoides]|uniref:scarecrow-like protein 28 n=1 Tax=Rutidosis leptorrhynchoides TaxID=125765 RepID=UPI003A997BEE
MLAGCSSSLLSPRHTKPSAQFQACHFPSMSTQRLDLQCNTTNLPRKESTRSHPVRPVSSLSVDNNPIEARTSSCSLKHNVVEKRSDIWESSKGLKRLYEDDEQDESFRVKRKRGCSKVEEFSGNEDNLRLGHLGSGNFWCPVTSLPYSLGPSNVISPNLRTGPWSFVNELADLGEKGVGSSSHRERAVKESSSGSGSRSSSPESHQISGLDPQTGGSNGVGAPNPNQSLDLLAVGNQTHDEEVGFELISLISACLEAISTKNIHVINHSISRLGELASPKGDSSIIRLASYYTEAIALRVSRIWPNIFQIATPRELNQIEEENGAALRLMNQATPIPKFIHFTSNEILLRSFEGKDKVHIIDFDIKQGLQWPSFFQSLASRNNPPSHVRITGVGESKQDLIETGARLSGFAESLNLEFEFHPVVDRLEDVRLWMLHVKEGETVGVNCVLQLHKMLYDNTGGALKDFFGLIRSINPSIVVVAEQESEHNEVVLEKRVSNSLKYYSAIFDCIDTVLPLQNSSNRIKIEESYGREIRNIIACEGLERIERHVGFNQWWKSISELGGFRNVEINEREVFQSEMILKMYGHPYGPNLFKVEKRRSDRGGTVGITLSWSDQPLYTVSAWTPSDMAGTSASYQPHQQQQP